MTEHAWAVIWRAHNAPVVRSYLWSIGFSGSAEEALTRAEDRAVGEGEEERRKVASPDLCPDLVVEEIPEIKYGVPSWAIMWKSMEPIVGVDGQFRVAARYLLFEDPEPTWELALEKAKAGLVELGTTNPLLAKSFARGTIYPVRTDMVVVGQKGTFYPVLTSAGVEVFEDPTKAEITADVERRAV